MHIPFATILAFFGLWESTLAVAAAAASIPIIIHLLNRKRFQVVVWAAMRFLLMAQRQNTRRMRLEQLILLALRTFIILLVVLAMASVMPWAEQVWASLWPDAAGFITARKGRTQKVIVIDGSLSMAVRLDDGTTAFERARELAGKIVLDSQAGDGFSVALMKDSPTWVVGEISPDAKKVAREIEDLQQAHGNASVPATLNMVASKLAEAPGRFDNREVYFLTDLQKATWATGQPSGLSGKARASKEKTILQEIQKRARTVFVDVGRDGASNLAVTNVTLGASLISTGMLVPVQAMVKNFGKELKQHVQVQLRVGLAGTKADSHFKWSVEAEDFFDFRPGQEQQVNFKHTFTQPGTYAVEVRLQPDDLEPDDARAVVVTVKDTIPVLLVNGKPAPEPFDRATEYLRMALNPFTGRIPRFAPLRPRVVTVSQFADASESNLAGYDCIFLADVGQLGAPEVRRLEAHLHRGGGLVISCGDNVADQIEQYNRLLYKDAKGLMPAKLLGLERAPREHYFYLQASEKAFELPPLLAFAGERERRTLQTPLFRQYVRARGAADARARTILTFMPDPDAPKSLPVDDPALLEWNPPLPPAELPKDKVSKDRRSGPDAQRYRGKVVLYTSTWNMDWNTWPGSPSYGALVQELTRVALAGKLRQQPYTVGATLEEYLPASGTELDVLLLLPGPDREPIKVRTQGAGDVTVFRWGYTDQSGVYRMTVGQDPQEYLFAVNVPTTTTDQSGRESDLTRLTNEQLKESYPDLDFQVVKELNEIRRTAGPAGADETQVVGGKLGPVIARYVLIAVLVLLLLEVVLAWGFGHYSKVAGATSPPASGALWPGLIAGIAGVLFIGGAAVLVHAYLTDDFLGFLPDVMRGWMEALLDIPPAPPGEVTRWRPETMPFLSEAANNLWLVGAIGLGAAVLIFAVYWREGATASVPYRVLMGGLRLFLVLLTLTVLGPQYWLSFERQGWPDVVLLIDDSGSMGEPDFYQEESVQIAVNKQAEKIRARLQEQLPEEIKALEAQQEEASKDAGRADEAARLAIQVQALQNRLAQVGSPNWRPARLQLIQSFLADDQPDWLKTLLDRRKMKVHIYHLDQDGRALKLKEAGPQGGELDDLTEPRQLEEARKAIATLKAHADESRLGSAVRQVLDNFRGSSLAAVVMLTDGVTTRDENLGQVADYAAQKGVPLFFVGVGDDHEVRDLKLHDLQVEDTIFVNDTAIFDARLTGHGYKDLTVPVVLKVREKDGTEKELNRIDVRVDPEGRAAKVRLTHKPTEPGEKLFIVQVEMPKKEAGDKGPLPANIRLQRTVFVQDTKLTKILFVEGSPRYEYRYIKNLLEREAPGKRNRTMDLKVLLLDADDDFPKQDRSAIAEFPINRVELFHYDVVIFGDVDPRFGKLSEQKLRDLADFVRERGGGFLMIAGPNFSPNAYKATPLADILPVDVLGPAPPEPEERTDGYRPELTPMGRMHPIFALSGNEAENQEIWNRLAPLYWWAENYRLKPAAEVLAVHPKVKAQGKGFEGRHPLVVQQFVGAGRSMFFGFDETWRWRFREDEIHFNKFWIQTVRYLSRSRQSRTELRLDRQTPYRQGEPIKVTVKFPDSGPLPGQQQGRPPDKLEVKVIVEHTGPGSGKDQADKEVQTLQLAKVEGSWATYEGLLTRTRQGKYRFWLSTPDVSKLQPNGQKPSAEADVVLPPGELDRLRMNRQEMKLAAAVTEGRFYTMANASDLLDELPAGMPIILNTTAPPWRMWNYWATFLLVLSLLTAEWFLRKRKHLL
jgi:uncharacterized membrane protein